MTEFIWFWWFDFATLAYDLLAPTTGLLGTDNLTSLLNSLGWVAFFGERLFFTTGFSPFWPKLDCWVGFCCCPGSYFSLLFGPFLPDCCFSWRDFALLFLFCLMNPTLSSSTAGRFQGEAFRNWLTGGSSFWSHFAILPIFWLNPGVWQSWESTTTSSWKGCNVFNCFYNFSIIIVFFNWIKISHPLMH